MGKLHGRRILVVEDEFLIALEVAATMEAAGAEAVVASSLHEALSLIADDTFDAAVLDVWLGDDEVFEAADVLAARGTPFVFHSGHANRELLCGRYEGAPVVTKPTPEAILRAAVIKALEGVTAEAA